MVHQYKLNGYNIVLDIFSGSVHAVDEVAYDAIAMYENSTADENTHSDEEIILEAQRKPDERGRE